jgi:hypothetical protein
MPHRGCLLCNLEDPHAIVYFFFFTDAEAVSIYPSAIAPFKSLPDGIEVVEAS